MKLGLGTVQFGLDYGIGNTIGRVKKREARAILQHALMNGMDTLDTAISYGKSETVLGQLGIKKWKTITKLPAAPDNCCDITKWVYDQTHQSMKRLGVSQLYGLLLHAPKQLLGSMGPALYAALLGLKTQGILQKIGVSIYSPSELCPLFDYYAIDIVQAPLNVLDRSLIESGWLRRLHENKVEIHTRSAFLQGLLLLPPDCRPAKFNRWVDVWNTWDGWLAQEGLSPLEGCLRYVCNLFEIDRVIVGVNTLNQLHEIIRAAEGQLTSLPEFDFFQDSRLTNPKNWENL